MKRVRAYVEGKVDVVSFCETNPDRFKRPLFSFLQPSSFVVLCCSIQFDRNPFASRKVRYDSKDQGPMTKDSSSVVLFKLYKQQKQ